MERRKKRDQQRRASCEQVKQTKMSSSDGQQNQSLGNSFQHGNAHNQETMRIYRQANVDILGKVRREFSPSTLRVNPVLP